MGFPAFGAFLGFADDNVIPVCAGNGAPNQQDVIGFADLNDLEVLGGAPDLTHVAGHFHAAHDGAGEKALADSAGAAMPAFGAVSGVAPGEVVPLDDAFEAAALGDSDGIHVIAGRKEGRAERVAWLHLFGEIAKLLDAYDGRAIEVLDVAKEGFGDTMLFLLVEAKLHGVVTVGLLRLTLQ